MRLVESSMHGGERSRGGAECIFVRGQFYDLGGGDAELARGFLDWLARLVDAQLSQVRVGIVPDRAHTGT